MYIYPTLCAHNRSGLLNVCRKALERTDARVLRLMFAMAPWDQTMNYTEGEREAKARHMDEVFRRFFAHAQALLAKFDPVSKSSRLAVTFTVRRACPLLDGRVLVHLACTSCGHFSDDWKKGRWLSSIPPSITISE